tara:strand:- start:366 stop:518 length:153 start_codon:yes stop_codon:yes gene_type:complete
MSRTGKEKNQKRKQYREALRHGFWRMQGPQQESTKEDREEAYALGLELSN